MKTNYLTTLATALLLCTSAVAHAQSVTGAATGTSQTTVNAAGSAVSGTTAVDADAEASGSTVSVDAGAAADLSLDANGDGTVDADETAAGAAASAGTTQSASEICSNVDLTAMGEAAQAEALAAATSAQVLRLSDCDDGTVGALSAEALDALTANMAITRVLEQETVGFGEILGVTIEAQAATIYVRDDEEDNAAAPTTAQ